MSRRALEYFQLNSFRLAMRQVKGERRKREFSPSQCDKFMFHIFRVIQRRHRVHSLPELFRAVVRLVDIVTASRVVQHHVGLRASDLRSRYVSQRNPAHSRNNRIRKLNAAGGRNMLAMEYARGRLKWDYVSNGGSGDQLEAIVREVAWLRIELGQLFSGLPSVAAVYTQSSRRFTGEPMHVRRTYVVGVRYRRLSVPNGLWFTTGVAAKLAFQASHRRQFERSNRARSSSSPDTPPVLSGTCYLAGYLLIQPRDRAVISDFSNPTWCSYIRFWREALLFRVIVSIKECYVKCVC